MAGLSQTSASAMASALRAATEVLSMINFLESL